jgi:hypothetical protein
MRKVIVFLLLGPLAVAIAVTMALVSQGIEPRFDWLIATVIFLVSLPVSAVVGVIDTALARRFSIEQRAGLTAAAGAIVSCVLIGASGNDAPALSILLPVAIFGAAGAWLCALLADGPGLEWSPQGYVMSLQAGSGVPAMQEKSLLRN